MERGEYERLYAMEDTLWWFQGMRAISVKLLERYVPRSSRPAAPIRILDVGCGTGGMLASLSSLGAVTALDSSEDALRLARRRDAAPLVRGSVSSLPFRSDTFDLVTAFDVIYHRNVANDELALRQIRRVTKPGGTVFVRVPAYDRIRSLHDEAVHTRQRYSKRELVTKFRNAGLEPIFTSFANSFLFPVALVRRGAERLAPPRRTGSEVEPVPAPLNVLLLALLRLEARILERVALPFGLSLVVVARRSTAAM